MARTPVSTQQVKIGRRYYPKPAKVTIQPVIDEVVKMSAKEADYILGNEAKRGWCGALLGILLLVVAVFRLIGAML